MRPEMPTPRRFTRAALPFISACLLACAVLVFTLPPPPRVGATARGKVVILLADRLGPDDFPADNTPFCSGLARRWSFGLMVAKTGEERAGREPDLGAEYVTLGSGVRSRGARAAGWSYDESERPAGFGGGRTAGELFGAFTGRDAPPGSAVSLGFQQVFRSNARGGTSSETGLLGALLSSNGLKASVAGSMDSLQGEWRPAPLVCCDDGGLVAAGALAGSAVRAEAPGGLRTDYGRLLQQCERLLAGTDLLVVETGDTGRIDRERPRSDEDLLEAQRRLALGRLDRFVRKLASLLDLESSSLLILSPGAPEESRERGDYLTPAIAAGRGFERGFLTSPTTRRSGLVTNIDVMPTVLSAFGLDAPSEVVGTAMRTASSRGLGAGHLRELDEQYQVTRRARWPVVITYLILVVAVTLASVLSLPGVRRRLALPPAPGRWVRAVPPVAAGLLAGPLSFIAVSAFRFGGYLFPALFCAGFMAAAGAAAFLLGRDRRRMDPVVSVCLLTAGVIVVDVLFGGRLALLPLLGDNPLEGARMYGLTNSIVAVLIAASVLGVPGLARENAAGPGRGRNAALAALLAVSFFIGFGRAGANAGGFIAALATSLTFFAATSKKRMRAITAGWIAGATAAGTAGMILLDAALSRTHAGRVAAGGSAGVLSLVQRKLGILADQLGFALVLSVLLIAATVAAALSLRSPRSPMASLWERYPWRADAFYSLAVGGIVALLFNDTGIAMMGMIAVVSVLAACYYATWNGRRGAAADPTPAG